MTVSHWPTFADDLVWCACDNRTFPTEEAWLAHVREVPGMLETFLVREAAIKFVHAWDEQHDPEVDAALNALEAAVTRWEALAAQAWGIQPSESSSGHAAPSR